MASCIRDGGAGHSGCAGVRRATGIGADDEEEVGTGEGDRLDLVVLDDLAFVRFVGETVVVDEEEAARSDMVLFSSREGA